MKNTIINVERTENGLKVTYSNGTVRTYHGKAPRTVYDWIDKNVTAPKAEKRRDEERKAKEIASKNPTNIVKIEETKDGRYKVTYYTGKARTFKKETLPSTAYKFWSFIETLAA